MIIGLKTVDEGGKNVPFPIFENSDIPFRPSQVKMGLGFLAGVDPR